MLSIGSLTVNHATREVSVDGAPVRLTAREFDLLSFLARAPRQVFSRRQLLQQVWGSSPNWQDDGTVAEHVYRVRRKLDPARSLPLDRDASRAWATGSRPAP